MTVAPGTDTLDGLAVGAATRERARQTGRPVAYQVLLELGWLWASVAGGAPHLVPPEGDQAHCGRPVPRGRRIAVRTGIASRGCRACLHHAYITQGITKEH